MKLAIFALFLGMAIASHPMMESWGPFGDMECLGKKFDTILARGYKSTCAVDKDAKSNFQKCRVARPGGCSFYISPTSKCDPKKAVNDFCDQVIIGMHMLFTIIVDIADPPNWGSNQSENRAWLEKLIQALKARYKDCVCLILIQTNKWEWEKIFGADYSAMSQYELMWEFLDHDPEFDPNTWIDFGGWTEPFSKIYTKGNEVCGQSVDEGTWQIKNEGKKIEFSIPLGRREAEE